MAWKKHDQNYNQSVIIKITQQNSEKPAKILIKLSLSIIVTWKVTIPL